MFSTRCSLVEGPASPLPALTPVVAWCMLQHYKAHLQQLIRLTFSLSLIPTSSLALSMHSFGNRNHKSDVVTLLEALMVCVSYCTILSQMDRQCSTEIPVSLSLESS